MPNKLYFFMKKIPNNIKVLIIIFFVIFGGVINHSIEEKVYSIKNSDFLKQLNLLLLKDNENVGPISINEFNQNFIEINFKDDVGDNSFFVKFNHDKLEFELNNIIKKDNLKNNIAINKNELIKFKEIINNINIINNNDKESLKNKILYQSRINGHIKLHYTNYKIKVYNYLNTLSLILTLFGFVFGLLYIFEYKEREKRREYGLES